MEQQDKSEYDELAELETFPEEEDVIAQESALIASESESEAHVTKACLASWRAKQKTAGIRNGRGFHG